MKDTTKMPYESLSSSGSFSSPYKIFTFLFSKQNRTFRYWQYRILFSLMFGYAAFYFVRQNFSVAIPSMEASLGYSKTELGWIMTSFAIIYGVGKSISGTFSDRSNARYFMSIGLALSAVTCLFMGFASYFWVLFAVWSLNACFQSMGAPPCQRLLTHWFSSKKIATKWAIWNASHQIGATVVTVFAGYLITAYGWRAAFIIPAIVTLGFVYFLFKGLRDTPESLGFPSIEEHVAIKNNEPIPVVEEEVLSFKDILFTRVLRNKWVWYMCWANMFFYVLRLGLINWAPTFLMESKGSSLIQASWQTAGFDVAAIFGGIVAGHLSDRAFKGRRGPIGALFMLVLMGLLIYFWYSPSHSVVINGIIMIIIGFFVSGPQILQGVAAADFASKKAAGTANGLTGTFGYLGASFSGVGIGKIVDLWGWNIAFLTLAASALISAFFFSLIWNHTAETVKAKRK